MSFWKGANIRMGSGNANIGIFKSRKDKWQIPPSSFLILEIAPLSFLILEIPHFIVPSFSFPRFPFLDFPFLLLVIGLGKVTYGNNRKHLTIR